MEVVQASGIPDYETAVDIVLNSAGRIPECQKDRVREDLALQYKYPGQHVAFVDEYTTERGVRRLHRVILAASPSLLKFNESLAVLPREQRARMESLYVERM
jgi:hypothetical protein